MKLTRVERWILANQLQILEKLDPENAKHYEEQRTALEEGFERHYAWLIEHIFDGDDTMSSDECDEVVDILDMFRALGSAYKGMDPKPDIEAWTIRFAGFDGNNETKQMAYARYFCDSDGGRFTDVGRGDDDFNSHMPTLGRYRRQLAVWRQFDKTHQLSSDQLKAIAEMGPHPDFQ